MIFLGIDYGKKKVGLAISEGQFATPLKILEVSSLEDALSKVMHIISEEGVEQVVIGMPESGEARKMAKRFAVRLHKDIPVTEFDETLTSVDAKRVMLDLNVGKKKRQREDAYSASIILQEFLNTLN